MVDKYFYKNRLDHEYNKELQKYNIILTTMTIGILGLFATFVWSPERIWVGSIIVFLLFIVLYVWSRKISKKMDELLKEIENIKHHS